MAGSKAKTKPPRGTRDFLPEAVAQRRYVTDMIQSVYEQHGFRPLETPSYERLETLLGKYGDEGDQLVFKLLRRGQALVDGIRDAGQYLATDGAVQVGRSGETAPGAETRLADYGLRYDLTVPLARVFAEHQAAWGGKLKRYQIQPVWRADAPGRGRFREFYQCDVDVVGDASLTVEVDVASAVATCLDRLGFADYEIRLNHRGLLRAFIAAVGIDASRETKALVALDKIDKVGADGVRAELEDTGIDRFAAERLLDAVQDGRLEAARALVDANGEGPAAVDALETVLRWAEATPAGPRFRFAPSLARGLGYYTGCIFEIVAPDLAGSLGGGGRYDGLIGMFSGRDVPACGFSLGLERLLVVMEARSLFPAALAAGPEYWLVPADADAGGRVLRIASTLRAAGRRVELQPLSKKFGPVRKHADEAAVPVVVFVSSEGTELPIWRRAQRTETKATITEARLFAEASDATPAGPGA